MNTPRSTVLRPATLILPTINVTSPPQGESAVPEVQQQSPPLIALAESLFEEMSEFDVKNLCIVPDYDGNPNELYHFISTATLLLNQFWNATDTNCFKNHLLIQGIISKLKGKARDVISIYGCTSWPSIKDILIQNFADQRNENSLTRDLVNQRQNLSETPLQFHEKIMGLLNTISNYIELHNEDENIKTSKKIFFQQQALTTFLAGLREPLGSTIRAMRPSNLSDAVQYIQEENNIRYLQKNNGPPQVIPKAPPHPQRPMPTYFNQRTFSQQPRFQQSQFHPPQTRQSQLHQPYIRQPQFQQQSWPKQAPLQKNHPFMKPNDPPRFQSANRPGPSQFPKPTPMSISTRNTNAPQTRTMGSTAMFNIEQYDEEAEYYPEYSSYQDGSYQDGSYQDRFYQDEPYQDQQEQPEEFPENQNFPIVQEENEDT